ncbi:4-hydroxybutyrate dehydrogenase [Gardnerella vaginalis]|uniref:4-hydroxybutyrate dehydrogenase n=1 Tax=Gardnerella vaginalis TaxID=2702 RepID=A0A3E1IP46_GARVA|nr:4-hydroxybutyrate dehydrogenase [Gardnerella vaginalis]RFD74772.1 4-hydroxybutyrate dehydrogenase [Gardnerella vaginalis]
MKQLSIKPTIHKFENARDFAQEFNLGKGDLVITNQYIWEPYFGDLNLDCDVIFQEKYGKGEPSDAMVDAIVSDIHTTPKRVIGIGGGTVLDISKVCALKQTSPLEDLVDGKIPAQKGADLILVPTTCGTGSEVTNVAVFSLTKRNTKKGLANDACYATDAVLIPELLKSLPDYVFATSSIDALTHSIESALSPIATELTKMFSYKACGLILQSYMRVVKEDSSAKAQVVGDLVSASLYAGIAFGNAGCGCVHAMAYPLGGTFHVAHGETNAALLTSVLRYYAKHDAESSTSAENTDLSKLFDFMANILECKNADVLDKLDEVLNTILPKHKLHEYGMTEDMIQSWAASVVKEQQRLLKNSYMHMDESAIAEVYASTF